ncbi:hypothetical protein N7475_002498 [Penicillium sp. IBT 31633x]|nr:hypothetical protein N7475_002498 [Penicillium sp. IBT 31633x]
MKSTLSSLLGLASLASLAAARTDLEGCVSSAVVVNHGASLLWYVPDSGEICSFLDCGGGRAPPKSTVPGCPLYTGTATVTPDYLEGWGPNGKQAASTSTVLSTASSTPEVVTASATQTSEASVESGSSSATASSSSDSSASSASSSPSDAGTTSRPVSSPNGSLGSMTITASPSLSTGDATSAAATSSPTFNAANTPAANGAGVVAIMAAMVGAFAL